MYLAIKNQGVADHRSFTLLGASATRTTGGIGQFGSGSKHATLLLLRHGIAPTICCGEDVLTFTTSKIQLNGQEFDQVLMNGKPLDMTIQWGTQDWADLNMAVREFVSNAIDAGGMSISTSEQVVPEPGCTTVFIPYTQAIKDIHVKLPDIFLHIRDPQLLNKSILPKQYPDKMLIYKKGVLVKELNQRSVFDYNLQELRLDESRVATEYDLRIAIGKLLQAASVVDLEELLRAICEDKKLWESRFDHYYLRGVESKLPEAWSRIAGTKGVATQGIVEIDGFVQQKGYRPIPLNNEWFGILSSCIGVRTQAHVLDKSEVKGNVVGAPTAKMLEAVSRVWKLLERAQMTRGKVCPGVKSFNSVMDGGTQMLGYYVPGSRDVCLHSSLGGKLLLETALEEVVHYVTGASDMSRDIQDFVFKLITEVSWRDF